MEKCNHIFAEKIYGCCETCGQRHNQEHCIKCDCAKKHVLLPCEHPDSNASEDIKRHHIINHIVQNFRFSPNPIDTDEHAAMSKRLSVLQGEMYLDAQKITSWEAFRKREMKKEYFKKLNHFLTEESKQYTILPEKKSIFKAFDLCPLDKIRIVINGQDPYLHADEAMGLSFSVPEGVKIPPSLRNIFTELKNDLKKPDHEFKNGDLTYLAEQGVLLINSILTVREGDSASHSKSGWSIYTDHVFQLLNTIERPMVYMMWGALAQEKKKFLTNSKHFKLVSGHPSPLSCKKFFGNHHFSQANEFLIRKNIEPIKWLT